jgi:hypothetical protein
VKHAIDGAVVAIGETQIKLGMIDIVGDLQIGQIAELVPIAEVIDGDDVGDAALVQARDDVAADESGGSCHHDGHVQLLLFFKVKPPVPAS